MAVFIYPNCLLCQSNVAGECQWEIVGSSVKWSSCLTPDSQQHVRCVPIFTQTLSLANNLSLHLTQLFFYSTERAAKGHVREMLTSKYARVSMATRRYREAGMDGTWQVSQVTQMKRTTRVMWDADMPLTADAAEAGSCAGTVPSAMPICCNLACN